MFPTACDGAEMSTAHAAADTADELAPEDVRKSLVDFYATDPSTGCISAHAQDHEALYAVSCDVGLSAVSNDSLDGFEFQTTPACAAQEAAAPALAPDSLRGHLPDLFFARTGSQGSESSLDANDDDRWKFRIM